jgi:hypothetical protein
MKIISKYKDYYDYLAGIYGIDEKLILDRTEFHITDTLTDNTKVSFFVCGYQVDGLYRDGKFYYGEQIEQFVEKREPFRWKWYHWDNDDASICYSVKTNHTGRGEYTQFLKEPTLDREKYNEHFECPILIVDTFGKHKHRGIKFSKFPILKDYGFSSVFTPDKIWQMLYDFLAKTKDIPNTQTDKEKIISRGFDYKHSFRNTK